MEILEIGETQNTPYVLLNPNGKIEIIGRSIPENSMSFYKPISAWMKEYSEQDTKHKTVATFQIEYFNTSSSKCLLDIFRRLDSMYMRGCDVQLHWVCDRNDNDLYEAGLDFETMLKCPLSIERIDLD